HWALFGLFYLRRAQRPDRPCPLPPVRGPPLPVRAIHVSIAGLWHICRSEPRAFRRKVSTAGGLGIYRYQRLPARAARNTRISMRAARASPEMVSSVASAAAPSDRPGM